MAATDRWQRAGAVAVMLLLATWVLMAPAGSDPGVAAAGDDGAPSVLVDGVLVQPPSGAVVDACGHRHRLRPGDVWESARCSGPSRLPGAELAALGIPVDLNTASAQELTSLPGVGPVVAQRIVHRRPYASIAALLDVSGIGPKTLKRIAERGFVAPSGLAPSPSPRRVDRSPPPPPLRRSSATPP